MRLLIVEDSSRLRNSLREGLVRSGYAVDTAADGPTGLQFAMHADYDVIVLDLMLPGLDGLLVLSALRRAGRKSRVLILSARDQVQDRIAGLHGGADDYLVKPFSFDELLARVKVLIRREYQQADPIIRLGEVVFDTALHCVKVAGQELPLTPFELSLFEVLVLNRGRVVSVASLEDRLYSFDSQVNRNTIEVHISKLRRKLRISGVAELIRTRRGFGYFVEAC